MTAKRQTPANIPLQFSPWRKEQFQSDDGIDFFNQWCQQLTNTVNAATGRAGRVQVPTGIDVQGSTISGLGAPQTPTDAVSSGHADANYGAPSVGPQLDLGGKYGLKGVANLYLWQQTGASGTISLAKLTGGGANGSITVTDGLIVAFTNPT